VSGIELYSQSYLDIGSMPFSGGSLNFNRTVSSSSLKFQKNCQFSYFKSLKNWRFSWKKWQRIDGSLADSMTFSHFSESCLIFKNCFFEYFESQWVSVHMPRLITNGYLSGILRTVQHWLVPFSSLQNLNTNQMAQLEIWLENTNHKPPSEMKISLS